MPHPKSKPPAQTDSTILSQMFQADKFLSGSPPAETIDASRVGIWAQLEKLRKEGFEFDEAICNKRYRIKQLSQELHSSLLQASLNQHSITVPLTFLEKTDSTNSEAQRQIAANINTPAIIIAKRQTKGQGRQGRKWESSSTGNLYCSFAFKPELSPPRMGAISLWIALCVCDFIKTQHNLPILIKWPNDLLIEGKKVSGFLAKADSDAGRIRSFIYGIGLNINGNSKDWPQELQNTASSLAAHADTPLNINAFTAEFIQCVLKAYEQFINGTYKKSLKSLWQTYDALQGKLINAYQGNTTLSGKAMGINDAGYLKLLLNDGTLKVLNNAEVSLTHKN